jgi:SSS family transporter
MLTPILSLQATSFGIADWAVIAGYFVLVLAIGAWVGRRPMDDQGYFLGGRSMPVWAVALSVVATSLSAVTFIGAPQEAFVGDLSYLILNLGSFVAVVIVAALFVPAFYRANTLTIYGYLAKRFGEPARIAVSCVFLLGRLLASGARLFIAAVAISVLFFGFGDHSFGQLVAAICVLGLVGTVYTVCGGIKAVIWTDVLQILVVIGAAVMSVVLLVRAIPLSVPEMIDALRQPVAMTGSGGEAATLQKLQVVHTPLDLSTPYTLWTGLFAVVFLNLAAYGTDHDLVQRMLTCKSALRGGLSVVLANVLGLGVVLLFMVIGLLLYLLSDPNIMGERAVQFTSSEKVYPQFLISYLPPGLSGLAMAGLLAAAMGSLDSAINAMASSLRADVYRPLRAALSSKPLAESSSRGSRWAVAIMGALLTAFAVFAAAIYDPKRDTLLGFALGVMSFAYAGMLGVFLTGLLTRRGNTISIFAALIVGALVVTAVQPTLLAWWSEAVFGEVWKVAWPWWMVFGTTASFVVCAAGPPSRKVRSLGAGDDDVALSAREVRQVRATVDR